MAGVDRRPAAVRARASAASPTAVNAGGHLGIFGFGATAALEEERLVLRRKRNVVFEAPLAALATVQIDSYGLTITTPLLQELAARDVPVLFARHGDRPWAVLRPLTGKASSDLLRAQVAAQSSPLGLAVARELIGGKLTNQERLLRYYAKYRRRRLSLAGEKMRNAAERISALKLSLSNHSDDDPAAARRSIFSVEGRAGSAYWTAMREILGDEFPGRHGRGAKDTINMALNYGYGILYAAVWGAVAKAGLDPGIGLLHASTWRPKLLGLRPRGAVSRSRRRSPGGQPSLAREDRQVEHRRRSHCSLTSRHCRSRWRGAAARDLLGRRLSAFGHSHRAPRKKPGAVAARWQATPGPENPMVDQRWLVLVDVAPSVVHDRVDRTLRNLGFTEIMPCVYQSRWLEPDRGSLIRDLKQARRRGVGRVVLGRLDRKGLTTL